MQKIFGKPDNISGFCNSDFGCHFKYMNLKQSIKMAKSILQKFVESGFKDIVIIESGTSPLISIIKRLKDYKKSNINFYQIKVPRSLDFNLYEWFKTYLTPSELNQKIDYAGIVQSRDLHLKVLCATTNLDNMIKAKKFDIYDSINDNFEYDLSTIKPFNELLNGTKLFKVFNSKFLVFDEYINAGTIIKNFNVMSKLFCVNADYHFSAFCMFLNQPKNNKKIAFTLYSKESELECYKNGAYPFENRVDLIGYYYYCDKSSFEKVYLPDLKKEFTDKGTITKLTHELYKIIKTNNLVYKTKSNCIEKEVKKYINDSDIIRYYIKQLEFCVNNSTKYYDFLDQIFEIYAPAWSPMPVKNHLDYWSAFEKAKADFVFDERLLKIYVKDRENLFAYIINLIIARNEKWNKKINNLLEVKNENN